MKRKTRNAAWIFLLALLSFPAGYLVAYVGDTRLVRNEQVLNLIAGGIACMLVLGALSTIIYFILRARKSDDPAKISLVVYTVFIVLMLISSGVQLPGAIKEKDRAEFLEGLRETLTTTFVQKIGEMPDAPAELKEHAQEAAVCIFYEIKNNDELVDKMMTVPDPKNFAATSPEVKKIVEKCFSLYMEPLPQIH